MLSTRTRWKFKSGPYELDLSFIHAVEAGKLPSNGFVGKIAERSCFVTKANPLRVGSDASDFALEVAEGLG